jgi:oxygen-independent coproporphyrinogen-3 oxidase
MQLVADQIGGRSTVSHLHFGGGSPDILTADQVDFLMTTLRRSFRFDANAEIAAELDPRGASDEVVRAFAANGLTRASFGVQVLAPEVQARINRIQPRRAVEQAIDRLRRAGVRALNLDLMYGLPGQTSEHIEEAASFAASQDADRVAVFGYAHVPWFKKHQNAIDADSLPGGEDRFRQAETAANVLVRAGYVPVGFDHYASPEDSLVKADRAGRLRRNFQGYTDDNADGLIAFGASAISMLPALAWQNTTDTAAYRKSLEAGVAPVVRGMEISAEDRRIGKIIEQILCRFEADIPADLRIEACPVLARLEADRLVSWSGNHLAVTDRGRPYVRNIAAAFDPDLRRIEKASARHSLAV